MIRVLLAALSLLAARPSLADDIGAQWFTAFKSGKAALAARVSVVKDLRYGVEGADQIVKDKVGDHLAKVFPKIRKLFAGSSVEKMNCTMAGKELAFMSEEWKDKSETVREWIRLIPDAFCTTNAIEPPKVWLVKAHDGTLPHAIVLFRTGTDDLVDAFYHF